MAMVNIQLVPSSKALDTTSWLRTYFWIFFRFFNLFCFSCFVAGAVLCGPCKAHFVAGAGLCGPWSAEFVAGAGLFVGLEVQISWQV